MTVFLNKRAVNHVVFYMSVCVLYVYVHGFEGLSLHWDICSVLFYLVGKSPMNY